MFPQSQEYIVPNKEVLAKIKRQDHTNYTFDIYAAYNVWDNLRYYNKSRNIKEALYHEGIYKTWFSAITHLMYCATNLETQRHLPIPTGTSIKLTHQAYNAEAHLTSILENNNAQLETRLPYGANQIHCDNTNPRAHLVYVNSGISILKAIIDKDHLERAQNIENIMTTYVNENTTVSRGLFNCYVLKNLYENTTCTNYTIFVDYIDRTVIEAFILAQIPITECLITDHTSLNNLLTTATALSANDVAIPRDIIVPTLYKALLTKIANNIITIAQEKITPEEKQQKFIEAVAPYLDIFYRILIKTYNDTSQSTFINNFCEVFNSFITGKDKRIIDTYPDKIANYFASIAELQNELHAANMRYSAYTPIGPELAQGFFDALKLFKNIQVIQNMNDSLMIRVISPLNFFDDRDANTIFSNGYSEPNRMINEFASNNNLDKFILRSIFCDIFLRRKYTIYTFTNITICLYKDSSTPITLNNTAEHPSYCDDYISQPHIGRYNCWESAKNAAYKAFSEQNFEAAFAQIVGATQNLTVSDSTVLRYLISNMLQHRNVKTIKNSETDSFVSLMDLYQQKVNEAKTTEESTNESEDKHEENEEE